MELSPCPFCGETGRYLYVIAEGYVYCGACDSKGPERADVADGVAAWNRRAPDPLREALLWEHAALKALQADHGASARMFVAAAMEVERLLGSHPNEAPTGVEA